MDIEGSLEVSLCSPGRGDLLVEVLNNTSKGKGEIRSYEGIFLILKMSPL